MIQTPRLDLVPASISLLEAALAGDAELARELRAELPSSWPPEHYDRQTVEYSLDHLRSSGESGWGTYLVVERVDGTRRLAGFGGFKGQPAGDGTVEIGYSIVAECQRRGLATEAVHGFLQYAFTDTRVTRVIAETLPELIPSQRVLYKAGFSLLGKGSEPGVIRFELRCPPSPS
jgi:RimJ/RimL family protein N-acetyltransferase